VELRTLRRLEEQRAGLLARRAAVGSLLESLVAVAAKGEEDEAAYTRLVGLFTALRRELTEHMALEEEAGFLAAAVAAAPRLSRRAASLAADHLALREQLDGILGRVLSAVHDSRAWSVIEGDFGRFSELLREHERAEERLVSAAYLDELGEGD
jgi:hypothetical protein